MKQKKVMVELITPIRKSSAASVTTRMSSAMRWSGLSISLARKASW